MLTSEQLQTALLALNTYIGHLKENIGYCKEANLNPSFWQEWLDKAFDSRTMLQTLKTKD